MPMLVRFIIYRRLKGVKFSTVIMKSEILQFYREAVSFSFSVGFFFFFFQIL